MFCKKNIEQRLHLFFHKILIKKTLTRFSVYTNFTELKKRIFQKKFLPISTTTFSCLKNILNESIEKMSKMIKKKNKNNFLDISDLLNIDFLQFFYSTEDLFLFRKMMLHKTEKLVGSKKFVDSKKNNMLRVSKVFLKIKKKKKNLLNYT